MRTLLAALLVLFLSALPRAAFAEDPPESPADGSHPALVDPTEATERAPDLYKVKFDTTKGDFVIEVHREWAPYGADRFYNLVKIGFYDDVAFFRVIDGFMAQTGLHGNPEVNAAWLHAKIPDDPPRKSNTRAMVSFATSGPHSRTTQFFINFVDRNAMLDSMGFAPFGEVIEGMDIVDALHDGYGEGAPRGAGPDQTLLRTRGNDYLKTSFKKLDYIETARIVE